MYPDLQTVKQIAAGGTYKRVPVCREILSDTYTPVEVMRILRKASRHCYLLESASQEEAWGRYSFLGYDPTMEITCLDGEVTIRENLGDGTETVTIKHVDHPGDTLREILVRYKSPVMITAYVIEPYFLYFKSSKLRNGCSGTEITVCNLGLTVTARFFFSLITT